jgi:hypothetical protein
VVRETCCVIHDPCGVILTANNLCKDIT